MGALDGRVILITGAARGQGEQEARLFAAEGGRVVLGDVFVEQDASLGIAQQPRQRSLAVEEWAIAHVLAVMLDEVEEVKDCGSSGPPTAQLLEP